MLRSILIVILSVIIPVTSALSDSQISQSDISTFGEEIFSSQDQQNTHSIPPIFEEAKMEFFPLIPSGGAVWDSN